MPPPQPGELRERALRLLSDAGGQTLEGKKGHQLRALIAFRSKEKEHWNELGDVWVPKEGFPFGQSMSVLWCERSEPVQRDPERQKVPAEGGLWMYPFRHPAKEGCSKVLTHFKPMG